MIVCTDEIHFGHNGAGESRMLPGMVSWMRNRRWIGRDSLLIREFPLNGRRVDLAVLTKEGTLSSFELKLGGFSRVLEQASYNQLNFDRSWVVVGGMPRPENLLMAKAFGIGVIVFSGDVPEVRIRPGKPNYDANLREQLLTRMKQIKASNV